MYLDDVTIVKAKVLATRRSTSVSKLVASEIERLVDEDDHYHEARLAALDQLARGFHLGGGAPPPRNSLHE